MATPVITSEARKIKSLAAEFFIILTLLLVAMPIFLDSRATNTILIGSPKLALPGN